MSGSRRLTALTLATHPLEEGLPGPRRAGERRVDPHPEAVLVRHGMVGALAVLCGCTRNPALTLIVYYFCQRKVCSSKRAVTSAPSRQHRRAYGGESFENLQSEHPSARLWLGGAWRSGCPDFCFQPQASYIKILPLIRPTRPSKEKGS